MVAQTAHIVLRFGNDALRKAVGQFIYGAGKQQVLPDEQTQPVTAVVERIVLEVTAAPHTDGIIIGPHTLTQQLLRALRGDSCQDAVLGDVVRAHGEDGDSVDAEFKLAAPFVRICFDGKRAQADVQVARIQHSAVRAGELHMQRVERMFSVAVGPPELRRIHMKRQSLPAAGAHSTLLPAAAVRACQRSVYGERPGCAAKAFQLRFDRYVDGVFAMRLTHPYIRKARHACGAQLDAAENTHIGQLGAPVPSVHAMCLAHLLKAVDRVARFVDRVFPLQPLGILRGGMEADADRIFARMQRGFDAGAPGAVHIVGTEKKRSVQVNVRDGVNAVADKFHAVCVQKIFRHSECAGIFVVAAQRQQGCILVVAVIGVLQQAIRQKIGAYRSGDRHIVKPGGAGFTHAPGPVQTDRFHVLTPLDRMWRCPG